VFGVGRRFKVVGLGSYYKQGGSVQPEGAAAMRSLAFLVKNKWPSSTSIQHPEHPRQQPVFLNTPAGACRYAAEIVAARWRDIWALLDLPPQQLTLVPVPSSVVTADTKDQTDVRWGARAFARELQAANLGTVQECVVNRVAKESGKQPPASEVLANFAVLSRPTGPVLYVDDVATRGNHLAAIDEALGRPALVGALAVAVTEMVETESALSGRLKQVSYSAMYDVRFESIDSMREPEPLF
jgi:hypothetical protein